MSERNPDFSFYTVQIQEYLIGNHFVYSLFSFDCQLIPFTTLSPNKFVYKVKNLNILQLKDIC